MLHVEIDIVRNKQVQIAVVVVIDKRGPGGPSRSPHAGLRRDVRKRSVAVVLEKVILSQAGYKQVVKAVVVVIANGATHAPSDVPNPHLVRDVREGAVTVVVIQGALRFRAGLHHVYGQRVDEEDVQVSVVIVIE